MLAIVRVWAMDAVYEKRTSDSVSADKKNFVLMMTCFFVAGDVINPYAKTQMDVKDIGL